MLGGHKGILKYSLILLAQIRIARGTDCIPQSSVSGRDFPELQLRYLWIPLPVSR